MNPSEASRQFQVAVETERTARTIFGDSISGEDEIAGAVLERVRAREQLIDALVAHESRDL